MQTSTWRWRNGPPLIDGVFHKMRGSLKVLLADKLEPRELRLLCKSYDVIGDIAVIRVPDPLEHKSKVIAEAVMQTHKRVKTVLRQTGPVSTE